jgi:hypothetical protein
MSALMMIPTVDSRMATPQIQIKSLLMVVPEIHVDPGVDVMITIFCDFRHFSVKKLAFFSKIYIMIKIFII